MIRTGPTGNVSKGHVLDCGERGLVEALRAYDPYLYVKWNPKKLRGWGCWEVRRAPETKTVREEDIYVFGGNTVVFPKYHEQSLVAHVMDVSHLNYKILEKLKKMDLWEQKDVGYKGKYLNNVLDYNQAKHEEALDEKSAKELEYNLKQMKSEIAWFREYVASGGNPYRLADHW